MAWFQCAQYSVLCGEGSKTSQLKARTHETHFTRIIAWGAGEQLTITANHDHEGAPMTVALMSGKKHFGFISGVTGTGAKFIENCFYSESN